MSSLKKQMKMMQKQMLMQQQLMQQQQQMMSMAPPASAPSSQKRPSKKGGAPSQFNMIPEQNPEHTFQEARAMSFEEKQHLSAGINRLNSNNLSQVVKIIKANMPSLGHGSDEIEVDLAALDSGTLWKLHNFVEASNSKKKRPKKPANTAQSRSKLLQQAQADAEHQLSMANAGLSSLGEDNGGSSALQRVGGSSVVEDESPSDSDSDGGMGTPLGI